MYTFIIWHQSCGVKTDQAYKTSCTKSVFYSIQVWI